MVTGIIFGIATGILCWQALSVSFFIRKVEDGENCRRCESRQGCFAHRNAAGSCCTFLERWMLFSFCKVRSYCCYVQRTRLYNLLICEAGALGIMMLLFWSKAVSLQIALYGISVSMLCMLSVVDWNTQYIPLECNVIILICGLIHLFADFSNWVEYIIGLFAVSGFLLFVDRIATPILRKRYEEELEIEHVIGDGDIKLMAATGLLLGWKLNFLALGIGCVAGSVIHLVLMKIKGSDRQFAFGPYLSLGVYITMICGEQLISWYLNMLGIKPI